MASDDPLSGLCGARVRSGDGYCQKYPINGTGRCRLHGGAGGAPKGNRNAVGNAGGGAPEGNLNALRNGLHVDPLTFYESLQQADQASVRRLFWEQVQRTDWRPDDVRLERLALAQITFGKEVTALGDTLRRGLLIDVEIGETPAGDPFVARRANSNSGRHLRLSRRHYDVLEDVGFLATGDATYFSAPRVIERPLAADRSFETILADAVATEALDEFGRIHDGYTLQCESTPDDRSLPPRLVGFLEWLADSLGTDIDLSPNLSEINVWRAIDVVNASSGPPTTVVSALCDEDETGPGSP